MIPLSYFLLAWFVLLGLFGLMTLLSVMQLLRYGMAGAGTYLSTTFFFLVVLIVVFGTSTYLLSVDWSQSVDIFGGLRNSTIFNP